MEKTQPITLGQLLPYLQRNDHDYTDLVQIVPYGRDWECEYDQISSGSDLLIPFYNFEVIELKPVQTDAIVQHNCAIRVMLSEYPLGGTL